MNQLKNIAEVLSGYTFRKAVSKAINGNYKIIQAKDVKLTVDLDCNNLDTTLIHSSFIKAQVKKGDIVLTARGRFNAAIVNSSTPTIASSSVYIVRSSTLKVNNYYLALFLNSKMGQFELSRATSGSLIKSLLKKNLLSIEIPLPDIKTQRQIVQLYKNIEEQEKLLKRKLILNSSINQQAMYNVVNYQ